MRRAMVSALAALALTCATPAYASRTAGLDAAGAVHTFVVGTDGALYHAPPGGVLARSGGEGLAEEPVGVVRDATGELVVIARAVDGTVYVLPGGEWSAREPIGTGAASSPEVLLNEDARLEVFFRGVDGKLWHTVQTLAGWSDPEARADQVAGEPVAALTQQHGPVVAIRLASGSLGLVSRTTGVWVAADTGAPVSSDATFVRHPADGRLELFVRGSDGKLWRVAQTSATSNFENPTPMTQSSVTGNPAAVLDNASQVHVFVRDAAGALLEVTDAGVENLGGSVSGTPVAIRAGSALIHVVAPSTGANWVARAQTAPNTWEPLFRSLGEATPPKLPEAPVVAPAPVPPPVIVSPAYPPLRIVVDLKANAKASKTSAVFKSLTLRGVPAGTTITATCEKGCKRSSLTLTNVMGTVSLKPFFAKRAKQGTLKVGTKIRVVVSGPNMISAVKTLTVRARRAPSVATRCIAPGATADSLCA